MFRKSTASDTPFLHQIMLVLGVAAFTMLLALSGKPMLMNQIQSKISLAQANVTAPISAANTPAKSAFAQPSKQQKSVATWLAKRYRVANDAAHLFVSEAYLTAKEFKLDPLLILSVMAIESGLNPLAESTAGAQGLMQVMSKIHHAKFKEFGGVKAALEPTANIRVGTQILKEYVTKGGSVEAGLKMYVGAALADTDGGYGSKVLDEYKRLKDVSNGKIVPTIVTASVPVIKAKPAVIEVQEESLDAPHDIITERVNEKRMESELVAVI